MPTVPGPRLAAIATESPVRINSWQFNRWPDVFHQFQSGGLIEGMHHSRIDRLVADPFCYHIQDRLQGFIGASAPGRTYPARHPSVQ